MEPRYKVVTLRKEVREGRSFSPDEFPPTPPVRWRPNAVMHRDWFIEGGLYTDWIEVVSPGGLPKGMTLADLGPKSVRRNALIADLLHRIDFIEKSGTGVIRIRDEAREGGYPERRRPIILSA